MPGAHHHEALEVSPSSKTFQLGPKNHILKGTYTVDQAGPAGQLLDEGAGWPDSTSACDDDRPSARPSIRRRHSKGGSTQHSDAWPYPTQLFGVFSDDVDGEPQALSRGGRRQRKWMSLPPIGARQEPK